MLRSTLAKCSFLILAALLLVGDVAAVSLPRLFSDGMVLQRNKPIRIWGWAKAHETVCVELVPEKSTKGTAQPAKGKNRGNRFVVQADGKGQWQGTLPALKATGPLTLNVWGEDEDRITVNDIWVGDVWLCSGQSNIDTNVERVYPQYPDEIDHDSTSQVRLFRIENTAALDGPRPDVRSQGWKTLSHTNAWSFSALGYFLGKRMAETTGVVQGILQSSWGGTPIEAWLPMDTVEALQPRVAAEARYYADENLQKASAEANRLASLRWNQLLDQLDPGVRGQWAFPNIDESDWEPANQYQLPISPAYGFCGTYWLRQHIHVDAAHAGQSALLLLGTLVDADYTYLNGKEVGQTYYQYPPRRYPVPENLFQEGDNVLVVRFVNRGMAPRFVAEKPYQLVWSDGTVQSLSAEWLTHNGIQMPSMPSMPTGYQNMAAATYNGMLSPLTPFALAGVVWYQGESNTGNAAFYERQLTSLMSDWRQVFDQPELPFVIVQLANFMAPSPQPQESGWARLRESQRRAAQADPHTELAVAIDLGEANDIHPLRKKELAERVALAFDKLVFGKQTYLSPQPVAVTATDEVTLVTFDQPLNEGPVEGFEVEREGRFQNANALVKGCEVIIHATGSRIRYAWKNNPTEANCLSKAGLPATPFEW